MHKILVVEDDPSIAAVLQEELGLWGYETTVAHDFSDILTTFCKLTPHLVLMDISLPFYNGFHWCAEIRKISSVPIIFISSAADNMSLITAIHQGADDFVSKPFDLQVLVAKVQALLRRTYDFAEPAHLLSFGEVVVDTAAMGAFCRNTNMDLTRNELKILQLLLEQKGRIVSRTSLMRTLWDNEAFIDDNTLTVNITRLRKKLDAAGAPDFIKTKKGSGYIVV
ncbi:MAG: response regulator transcription factor [Oscillospiraceae bacterium]